MSGVVCVCWKCTRTEMKVHQNTKHAAHKTPIDRQAKKSTYTHDINS